jgi:hypothetical protein
MGKYSMFVAGEEKEKEEGKEERRRKEEKKEKGKKSKARTNMTCTLSKQIRNLSLLLSLPIRAFRK